MTFMETEYLKGWDGTYSQNRGQAYRGDTKNCGGWGGGGGVIKYPKIHGQLSGPLLRGQPYLSDVNYCVLTYLTGRSLGAS